MIDLPWKEIAPTIQEQADLFMIWRAAGLPIQKWGKDVPIFYGEFIDEVKLDAEIRRTVKEYLHLNLRRGTMDESETTFVHQPEVMEPEETQSKAVETQGMGKVPQLLFDFRADLDAGLEELDRNTTRVRKALGLLNDHMETRADSIEEMVKKVKKHSDDIGI